MQHMLRISEAASLALHTMSLLARHTDRRYSNQEIAELLQASEHSLAKVMQRLSRANLVNSLRGPSGGFQLGRAADQITVLEIYEAVDGPLGKPGCLLGKGPCISDDCLLGGLVCQVHDLIRTNFGGTTLAALSASMKLGDAQYGAPQHS